MRKSILQSVKARLLGWRIFGNTMVWCAIVCLASITLVAADALFVLPAGIRESGLAIFLTIVLVALAGCLLPAMLWSDARAARWLENKMPSLGTVLTNALQLAEGSSSSVEEQVLREQAVNLGRTSAAGVPVRPLMGPFLKGTALTLVVTLVVSAALALFFSDVIDAVLPRYLDPAGDHPPYSRIQFEVEPGNVEVLYGQSCDVKVRTNVDILESLDLVTLTAQGEERIPMFALPGQGFFQSLSQLREPTQYYVASGKIRSRRHTISIKMTPRIQTVTVSLEYPEYTGLGKRRLKLGNEATSVPAGTMVELTASSNRPLSGGTITLTPVAGGDIRTVSMAAAQRDYEVSGSLKVEKSFVFSIEVTDKDGLNSVDNRTGRLEAIPDKRPRVIVMEPGKQAVATPKTIIPVHVQAEDDYSVDKVFWFRGINRSVERSRKIGGSSGLKRVEAVNQFDLADLGVNPGDKIDYFFEAVDNNPLGPGLSTSRMFSVEIISEEQYEEILRRRKAGKELMRDYELLGAWLRRLDDRAQDLQKRLDEGADVQGLASDFEALKTNLRQYMLKLEEVRNNKQYFDIEKIFHATLKNQADALTSLQGNLSQIPIDEYPASGILQVSSLLKELTQRESQEIGEPIQELKIVLDIIERFERFETLTGMEKELVRLAARFSQELELSRINRMELQEITAMQKDISREVRQISEDMKNYMKQLRKDQVYVELHNLMASFLNQFDKLSIDYDLADAADRFAGLEGPEGYKVAKQASKNMEKLLEGCGGARAAGFAGLRLSPTLSGKLGSTLDQIMAATGAHYGEGKDGYSLLSQNTALYGPGALPPEGESNDASGPATSETRRNRQKIMAGNASDPDIEFNGKSIKVKLDTNAKYPMQYRKLVGEYFRKVAETGSALNISNESNTPQESGKDYGNQDIQ